MPQPFVLLSAILLATVTAPSSSSTSASNHVTLAAERFVVPGNGLEVLLSPDHSLPLANVAVWYHVGPAHEPEGRTGFAHLFEHLMFQGSAHVGDDQHLSLLEARGASLINGSTSFDWTNYYETVPANELALALWLESDRMGFLAEQINQATLDNQRQVVMNERRQRVDNQPYGPSNEAVMHALVPKSHPYYGNIIGSMDDLARASVDDVRAFYAQYYAPANATLTITGDFDPAEAKAMVHRYFGTLPARAKPAPRTVAPIQASAQRLVVQEPVQLALLTKAWLSPRAFAPLDAEADFLAQILGGGQSSRLHRRLVYELGLAKEVGVAQSSRGLVSTFSIEVLAQPGADIARIEQEVDAALAKARTQPPSDGEMLRARNQLETSLQRIDSMWSRTLQLNYYNAYLGEPNFLPQDLARVRAVSPAGVVRFAETYLSPDQQVVVITEPSHP